jgi:hypothetical protein
MSGPLAGISAAQVAQQKLPDQAAQQGAKGSPSKFDKSLDPQGGANQTKATDHVQQAQKIQHIEQAKKIDNVQKTVNSDMSKSDRNQAKGIEPVTQKAEVSKSTSMVSSMIASLEKGQVNIDKIINGSMSGKSMSNGELLQMQAGMYKYTQEIDLCSKVVEKATSGLKDTLKTQV